jgi:hypothetical protein
MARGSSLSDDQVISKVNSDFIAVDNNISDQDWPADTPALDPWQRWLSFHPNNAQNGFTTSVVISPDGKMALGTSGSGYISEWHTSVCYDAKKYSGFLDGTLERYKQYLDLAKITDPFQRGAAALKMVRDINLENHSRQHPEAAFNH